jgi:tetratricopeptide (TPR) repeat protein
MEQKEKLLADNQRLKGDLATLLENFDTLKEAYQELQAKEEASQKENAELRSLLTKQVQAAPEYQMLDREAKRLREENAKLGETINLLDARLKKALERIKRDQERDVSQLRQIREQKLGLDTLRSQIGSLTSGNRELNQLINEAPDKIRVMAAQNKQLLRETAEMHYNMGVFFTDNKEFTRAEKEYRRALDFDPENLKVHYNLGYLYAEDLNKQDKAAFHLEKYLQLSPDAKDSEAVRATITTLSVWNQDGSARKS